MSLRQKDKRVFGLVIDFGTSQSPKSTRPLTTYWCPSRPGHPALRNNFVSSLLLRTWLPYDWTPRSEACFVFPLAPRHAGKQCCLTATGDYQPSLRSPWLAAIAVFLFHGCLNDFLPKEKRFQAIPYSFSGNPGIKDPVETLGIPHSEVGSIEVNGQPVDFKYQL